MSGALQTSELLSLTARRAAELLRGGEVSPAELAEAYLDRIDGDAESDVIGFVDVFEQLGTLPFETFFDDEETLLQGIQHLRFAGHEVIVMQVMDPQELEFEFEGLVEFEGLENIPELKTRPAEVRQSYLKEVEAFQTRLRHGCERNDCHFVSINTSDSMREVLASYLAFRRKTGAKS